MPETYHAADFPHGLKCMDCDRQFHEGMEIRERLTGFVGGSTPAAAVDVICAACDDAETAVSEKE